MPIVVIIIVFAIVRVACADRPTAKRTVSQYKSKTFAVIAYS